MLRPLLFCTTLLGVLHFVILPPSAASAADSAREEHWAFVVPKRPTPPAVQRDAWIRNDIDHFVLSRLEREGRSPSPEADRFTLIRRVTLDLTGLPPAPEVVDAFASNPSDEAYSELVGDLMSSVHYGERMAINWLDQVRYADSNGYHSDEERVVRRVVLSLRQSWDIDAAQGFDPLTHGLWELGSVFHELGKFEKEEEILTELAVLLRLRPAWSNIDHECYTRLDQSLVALGESVMELAQGLHGAAREAKLQGAVCVFKEAQEFRAAEGDMDDAEEEAAAADDSQVTSGKKRKAIKLPKRPPEAESSEDSKQAAEDMLRKYFNRS